MTYNEALARARKRAQAIRNAAAESYAIATSPIRYAQSEASVARQIRDAELLKLGLCCHGRVPRRVAERMAMPRLACKRCA